MLMLPKSAFRRGTPGIEAQVIVREIPTSQSAAHTHGSTTRTRRATKERTIHARTMRVHMNDEETRDTAGTGDVPRALSP